MAKRSKKPYLLNPVNPMEQFTPRIRVWRDPESGKFGDKAKKHEVIMRRRQTEKDLLGVHHFSLAHRKKIASKRKKTVKVHKAAGHAWALKMLAARKRKQAMRVAAAKKSAKGMLHVAKHVSRKHIASKAVAKVVKITHRSHNMAKRRKSSKKSHRKNPFSPAAIMGGAKKLVRTDLLIDGALVAGGMVASKYGVEFLGSKWAPLSTPIGKIGTRLGLGLGVLALSKYAKVGSRYAEPFAVGFIAPAVLDVVEMVLPMVGFAGGVKLLESGYMPDVRSQVSLESGYMPDVQSSVSLEQGYMPDVAPELQ